MGLRKIRKDDQFVEHCQVTKKQNMPGVTPGVNIFVGGGGGRDLRGKFFIDSMINKISVLS